MKCTLIMMALLCVSACSPKMHRGKFELISTESVNHKFEVLSRERISGRACFNFLKMQLMLGDGVFDAAVVDALKKVPEARLLLDAEFKDSGSCIHVSGIPAKERNYN